MCEGVSEGLGYWHDMNIHVEIYLSLVSVFVNVKSWHYMCTWVGSNPCRTIPVMGIGHHIVKIFQVQEVHEEVGLI